MLLATERLIDALFLVNHIVSLSRAAGTTNGTGVDVSDCDGVLAILALGDIGATTTLDCKLQESDDNSSWSDITGAAIVQIPATGDNALPTIDVRWGGRANHKKYVRAVAVVTGSNSASFAVILVKYNCTTEPQTQTTAAIKP